ncbi:OmpA family protein [Acetobacter fallax]|uniref:OmpA family protein n=1 Tax=Acetobacter fallax TaxID=1737473 RepID=A0ABX0KCG7_9PROT|nr:OmpA family protein [Acetobacter fallax]NHO32853.1 OmpA family protein [Acetobacter fallax]NHO36363.1 OmpA family protein [Acetobacter fallax]
MSLLSMTFSDRRFSRRIRLAACLSGAGALLIMLSVTEATAQVTTDTSALDSIAPVKKPAAPERSQSREATRRHGNGGAETTRHSHPEPAATSARKAETAAPAGGTGAAQGSRVSGARSESAPGKPPPPATIPLAPPPLPVLTPPSVPVELHPFPMPADPPAEKDAVGNAVPVEGGMRITFAPDSVKLNTETRAAILAVAQALKERPETRALVDSTASGPVNDPSRPRRMSLSRGLVVRAVLMNAGIPSTRIYVRVIGSPSKTGIELPADRVDIRRSDAVP